MNNIVNMDEEIRDFLNNLINNVQQKTLNRNHYQNLGNNYKFSNFPVVLITYGDYNDKMIDSLLGKLQTTWTNADLIVPIKINSGISAADAVQIVNSQFQACLQSEKRYAEYNKCFVAHIISSRNGNCNEYLSLINEINNYLKSANVVTKFYKSVFALFYRDDVAKYNDLLNAVKEHKSVLNNVYLIGNSKQNGQIVSENSTELFDIIGNTILLASSTSFVGNNDNSDVICNSLLQVDRYRLIQVSYEKAQKPDKEIVLVSLYNLLLMFKNGIPNARDYSDVRNKLGADASSGFLEKYYTEQIKPQLPKNTDALFSSFPFSRQHYDMVLKTACKIDSDFLDKLTNNCWSAFVDNFVKSLSFNKEMCYKACIEFICSKVTVADIYAHFGKSELLIDIDNDINVPTSFSYSGNKKQFYSLLSAVFQSQVMLHFAQNINDCLKQAVTDLNIMVHKIVEYTNRLIDFSNREIGIRDEMSVQINKKFTDLFDSIRNQHYTDQAKMLSDFVDFSYTGKEYSFKDYMNKIADKLDLIFEKEEYQYDFTDELSYILGDNINKPELGEVLKQLLINNSDTKRYFQHANMSNTLQAIIKCVLFNGKTKIADYKKVFSNEYSFFDNNCIDCIETICYYECTGEII